MCIYTGAKHTGALKRKVHTMMFMKFKFNFKENKRFRVNIVTKLYSD